MWEFQCSQARSFAVFSIFVRSSSSSSSMSFKFSSASPALLSFDPPHPPSRASSICFIHFTSSRIHRHNEAKLILPSPLHRNRSKLPPLLSSPLQDPQPTSDDPPDYQSPARDALSQLLHREFGLSEEEAAGISSGAPNYIAMLIDGVKELDELSLWDSSWKGTPLVSAPGVSGFKEKVAFMAMQRGDCGKVAFLESIGLSLSSAMNVARYLALSSDALPTLVSKVKLMKELLFSSNDVEGLSGKNARRMMMHLSIPVDEDVQQTLSFFEKIEARRRGLDMLSDKDVSFLYLIESFPRLLLLSTEYHLNPLVEFFKSAGVPHGKIRNIILLFPPVVFYDIRDLSKKLLIFEKVLVDSNGIGTVLLKYPWILSTSIQKNYEEILWFFHMEKVQETCVQCAIRRLPHILGCSTSKLKLMVEALAELVRNKKLGKVIAKSPQLLLRKPDEFFQVVSLLENLGFDRETVGKILIRCPEIFGASIERTLNKKLEFLKSMGIAYDHLPRVIKKYPEVLVSDVNRALVPRINYLKEIGLTKREIAFMVRRFSPLLGYSIEEVFRPKVEFLVTIMGKPLKEVVEYPRYFSYSLEKKIKPRYCVLKGRKVECSLKDMLSKNNEEFAAEFLDMERMLVLPARSPH